MKKCTELNLGDGLCIINFLYLVDSGLFLNFMDGFDFNFRWRYSESKQSLTRV